jgi:hypothetical protein
MLGGEGEGPLNPPVSWMCLTLFILSMVSGTDQSICNDIHSIKKTL